jgi:hypothetical protein
MRINEEEETAKCTAHNNTKCILWVIRAKAQETAEHRIKKKTAQPEGSNLTVKIKLGLLKE